MVVYFPQNVITNDTNNYFLLPLVTTKKDINFYCKSDNRLDPSILLVDPQNNCILEESVRIGINTKLYEKNKWENYNKNVSVSHLKK